MSQHYICDNVCIFLTAYLTELRSHDPSFLWDRASRWLRSGMRNIWKVTILLYFTNELIICFMLDENCKEIYYNICFRYINILHKCVRLLWRSGTASDVWHRLFLVLHSCNVTKRELSSANQDATSQTLDRRWGTECLDTGSPLPSYFMRYGVNLKK